MDEDVEPKMSIEQIKIYYDNSRSYFDDFKELPVLHIDKVKQLYDMFYGKFNPSLLDYQRGNTLGYKTDFLSANPDKIRYSKTIEAFNKTNELSLLEMNEHFLPAPFDFVVYRCIDKINKPNYCDKGFTSTSLFPNNYFCYSDSKLMIIHIPKGYLVILLVYLQE